MHAQHTAALALNQTRADVVLAGSAPQLGRFFNPSTERDISAYYLKAVLLGKPDNLISSTFEYLRVRLNTVCS